MLTAADEELGSTELNEVTTNRFFEVPVLNRGGIVDLAFLVHAPTGVVPNLLLHTDHKGVRLRPEPPKPKFLGVRNDYATWAGFLVLCSQSLFRFADLGDDGLCRGGPDKGCGVIVSAIDVVVDRLD